MFRTIPMSENASHIYITRYADKSKNETVGDINFRVASYIAQGERNFKDTGNEQKWLNKFLQVIDERRFYPNSPCLRHAGVEGKGSLSACFTISPQDNLNSIMETAWHAALVEKWGGGIGFGLSALRQKGAAIGTTHGVACGPISVLKLYSKVGETLTQGAFRLGAHMAQLSCSHPDIQEFIHVKDNDDQIANFNISVQVTDAFMQAVRDGGEWNLIDPRDGSVVKTVNARGLWNEICTSAWKTGDPGVVFMDRVWETAPNPQLGKIQTSNPCWSGDTLVWTINGPKRFDELAGGPDIPVLTMLDDGAMAFRMMRNPRMTRDSAKTIQVTMESRTKKGRVRSVVTLTPDHNLFLKNGKKISASDLVPGDRIASVYRSLANSKGYLKLYNGIESDMEHRIVASWEYGTRPSYPEFHVDHIDQNKKNNLPENLRVLCHEEHNALKMYGANNPVNRFPDKNPFNTMDFSGDRNGMFGKKHSDETKAKIGAKSLGRHQAGRKKKESVVNHVVISIHDGPEIPVYNGTVDETHRYYVQVAENEGILSANCGEEFLENYGNCCLGSIDLGKHITEDGKIDYLVLRDTVRTGVRFLDDVIEMNQFPLQELKEMNLKTRRIGLGVMGWADALIEMGIKYDSEEAVSIASEVAKFIHDTAWEMSRELASERGSFPEYEKSALVGRYGGPVRHSSVITIAPTGTISRLADCSSGIEPHFSYAWASNVLWTDHNGTSTRMYDCPVSLRKYLSQEQIRAVALAPSRDEAMKILKEAGVPLDVYRTTNDISGEWHVKMQAAWQRWVTNSVSKTINMPNSATVDDVMKAFELAFELKCKAVTVYRDGSKSMQVLETGETKSRHDDVVVHERPKNLSPQDRPSLLSGTTDRIRTGHGTMYITVNHYDNAPFEVFSTVGKGGGCDAAWLEGVSRLASLALRSGVSPDEVIDQLRGIRCDPFYDNGVLIQSPADAIAIALERVVKGGVELSQKAEAVQPQLEAKKVSSKKNSCPECYSQSVVYEEGCFKCYACGFSRCEG